MSGIFSRNELFWGVEVQEDLTRRHVAVIGLGGVGGFCAEMLARAGVGELTIADFDVVSHSNINRQIIALQTTVGQKKTDLWRERLTNINPLLKLNVIDDFCTGFDLSNVDYIADAIDTMRSKISLLEYAAENSVPIISSFGAGNRIDPTKLYVCDISQVKEKNAPFVSNIIYQLNKRGIKRGITVVASTEKPSSQEKITKLEQITKKNGEMIEFQKIMPASTPFVAPVAGIMMASHIVGEMINLG